MDAHKTKELLDMHLMRPCRLASGRADGDKSAGQQPKEGGGMLRRSRCALVFAVALAWGCDQDGATAPRAKTPPRPAALATAVGSITDLGNLPGASSAQGFAINDRGQVVGCSYLQFCNLASGSRDPQRAFLWDPITQHLTDLSLPSTAPSEAFGINETGQVVGSVNSDGRRAFLWDPSTGTMIIISDPLTPGAEATAINGRGQVVGASAGADGAAHAFLWTPGAPNGATGTMNDLGSLPGGSASRAFGINDRGQVVGCSYISSSTTFCDLFSGDAFLWTPDVQNGTTGTMIGLGALPGGSGSAARGINNAGQVVGGSGVNGAAHAVLWTITETSVPLAITPPGPITLPTDPGRCDAQVGIAPPTTTGGTPPVTLAASPLPPYPVGQTTVTWTATDATGSTASATQTAAVFDRAGFSITAPATVTLEAGPGGTASVDPSRLLATVGANCPGGITVTSVRSDGLLLDAPYPLGATRVTFTATDPSGRSLSASTTVTVIDTTPPSLTLPGNVVVNATSPSGAVVFYVTSARDIAAGAVPVSCRPASGGTFPIGTTTVTCTASDPSGNTSGGAFAVTVVSAPTQIANLARALTSLGDRESGV